VPVADAVVSLHGPTVPAPEVPASSFSLSQVGLRFDPHVLVIPRGASVVFPNRDRVRHHVYSFSPARNFELKLYSGTPADPVRFDRAGTVELGCNVHDWMLGFIVVLDTPWWTRSNQAGQASLADIPPGDYELRVWHSRLAPGSPGLRQPLNLPLATDEPVRIMLPLLPAPDLEPPSLGFGLP
jgi:plastocyanin